MQWKMAYAHHEQARQKQFCTISDIEESGFPILSASVPGCLEQELMKAGKLDDLYFSTNTLQAQKLEDVHVWYFTKVQIEKKNQYLRFEGIDTFSDIYINGKLVRSTDNMFLAYDVDADWNIGANEVVVHIKPTMLEARKFTLPAVSYALRYNYAALYVRKAAHMFGWDIMPRIVSAGLWKAVKLCERKQDAIEEAYMVTHEIKTREDGTNLAYMRCFHSYKLKRRVRIGLSGARGGHLRRESLCGGTETVAYNDKAGF